MFKVTVGFIMYKLGVRFLELAPNCNTRKNCLCRYLRRRKDQHREPDAREQSVAVMVTEVRGDTLQHSSSPAAQTSGTYVI